MELRSKITVLVIGLSLLSMACAKKKATSIATMAEDDKHALFQALLNGGDPQQMNDFTHKLGISDAKGLPTPAMQPFMQAHSNWIAKNIAFVREYGDKEKAREYVKDNMP